MLDEWKKISNRPLRFCNWFICFLVVGMSIFLIAYWKQIPDQVPMHWNGAGEIDRLSNKGGYIVVVFLMYFFWAIHGLMMFVIPKSSGKENLFPKEVAVRATEEDRLKGAKAILYFLTAMDVTCELMCAYIIMCGVTVSNLGAWFLPGVFIVMVAESIWYFWKQRQIQKEIL